jgi:hypothetical protein
MESSARPAGVAATTTGWRNVFAASAKTAVVGFVVLQAKEWFDAGMFDTTATAVDALLIAGGLLVVNAILKVTKA